jgi:FKBP12-rapamycin complex-associated protein
MKCLHALGEWDQLAAQVKESWANANHEDRKEIAPTAAETAWSLRMGLDGRLYCNNPI